MQAYMNISVRVLSAQAQAQIKALQAQVAMLEGQLAKANMTSSGPNAIGGAKNRKTLMAWGNQIQWTGRQLQYNWTLPLLLAGGAATKFALDNEKAFTRVEKVYGDADAAAAWFRKNQEAIPDGMNAVQAAAAAESGELKALGETFEALSTRYGVLQKDVIEASSAWAAAGVSGAALARSTELTLKAAALGDIELTKATSDLIAIQAQYGLSTEELSLTLAQLNAVENATGAQMKDLIAGFERAGGVARGAGIDVRHLAAMMAALVPAAGSASTAGNSIRTMISRLMSPTRESTRLMQEFGVETSSAAWNSMNALERMQIIANKMSDTLKPTSDGLYEISDSQKQVIASTLGSRWQMNRFLILMREMSSENSYYQKSLDATSSDTKAFATAQKELEAILKSNPQRLKIMWATLQNGMADVIQPLIPYIIYLAQSLGNMVDKFSSLNPAVQKFALIAAIALMAVGPLVRYFGSLGTLIGAGAEGVKFFGRRWSALTTVTREVDGELQKTRVSFLGMIRSMVTAPFSFIAGALSSIVSKGTNGVKSGFDSVKKTHDAFFNSVVDANSDGRVAKSSSRMWTQVIEIESGAAANRLSIAAAASTNIAATEATEQTRRVFVMGAGSTARVSAESAESAQRVFAMGAGATARVAAETASEAQRTTALAIGSGARQASESYEATRRVFIAGQAGAARVVAENASEVQRVIAVNQYGIARVTTEAASQAKILAIQSGASANRLAIDTAEGTSRSTIANLVAYSRMATEKEEAFGRLFIVERGGVARTAAEVAAAEARLAAILKFAVSARTFESIAQAEMLAIQVAYHSESVALWEAYYLYLLRLKGIHNAAFNGIEAGSSASRLALQAGSMAAMAQAEAAGSTARSAIAAGSSSSRLAIEAGSGTAQTALAVRTQGTLVAVERTGGLARVGIAGATTAAVTGIWARSLAFLKVMIISSTKWIIAAFAALGRGVLVALTGPWGWAILAVVSLLYGFRKQIEDIWDSVVSYFSDTNNAVVSGIISAWNMLPQGVANALTAVARIVQTVALQIYELFSYLNPFARHSPSLVENVTNGMAIVGEQFGLATGVISGHVKGAYRDIKMFGSAVANLLGGAASFDQAQQRAKIQKFAPGALDEFDQLANRLRQLQGDLKATQTVMDRQQSVVDRWTNAVARANAEIDKQQEKLDKLTAIQNRWQSALDAAQSELSRYADAPLVGMGAMSDAIFENEMAQKRLRLEIMRMEEATGPLDDIKSKIDAINGAQEALRGEQAALRSAGAGSDILSHYDDQIAALEATKRQQGEAAESINNMSTALEELQRKGELLDLENSLKFDPLTRQIDQAANAMEEMPFDVIIAGVRAASADIGVYQDKLDIATAAVDKQRAVVDSLSASRDVLQGRLDAEEKKLDLIKSAYDEVAEAIRSVESTMNDAAGAAETMIRKVEDAAKKAKKAADASGGAVSPAVENFRNAAGGNFPEVGGAGIPMRSNWESQVSDIEAETQRIANEAAAAMGNINPFSGIGKKWDQFKGWFLGVWRSASSAVSDIMSSAMGSSSFDSGADKFRIAWTATSDWFKSYVIDPLLSIWEFFGPTIVRIVENTWNGIVRAFQLIYPELEKLFDELKQVGPIFTFIGEGIKRQWTVLKPLIGLIVGLLAIAIKVIGSIFGEVIYPVLEMLGGLFANTIKIFRGMIKIVTGFFTLFTDPMEGFKKMGEGVLLTWEGTFGMIFDVIVGAVKIIVAQVRGFGNAIIDIFAWIMDVLVGHSIVPDMVKAIVWWFQKLIDIVKWLWNNVATPIINVFKVLLSTVVALVKLWWTGITTAWSILKTISGWLWTNVLKPIADVFASLWNNFVKPGLSLWWEGVKIAWAGLLLVATWLWENVLGPVWQGFKTLWSLVRGGLKVWWSGVTTVWGALKGLSKWLWSNVLHPAWKRFKELWDRVSPELAKWWARIQFAWAVLKGLAKWVWDKVLSPVLTRVKDLWLRVKSSLGDWYGGIKNVWKSLTNIGSWFKVNVMDKIFSSVKNGWTAIRDWLTDHRDMLLSPMKGIVNVMIGAVNKIVGGLNKVAKILPGVDWKIDAIPKLAQGGDIPSRRGTRGFKTTGARAIVGEGKANYPEFVIPTDPTYRSRAKSLLSMAASKIGISKGIDSRGAAGDTRSDAMRVLRQNPQGEIPKFAIGGWIKDKYSDAKSGVKKLGKELAKLPGKAIGKVMDPLLDAGRRTVRGAGWEPIESPPLYGIDKLEKWVKGSDKSLDGVVKKAKDNESGGPKVRRALKWAREQEGKPYAWGGIGSLGGGFDCSGFMGAITNVLEGKPINTRRGTTATFPWSGFKSGAGPAKGFTIGSSRSYGSSGIGHMAGTLGGVNVESRGGEGVVIGSRARGYSDPGFAQRAFLPLKEGGIALARRGPTLAAIGDGRYDEAVVPLPRGWRSDLIGPSSGDRTININGDLSFPNIKSGDDAKTFLDNLESLADK